MNDITFNQRSLRQNNAIKILIVIALMCYVFTGLLNLCSYEYEYGDVHSLVYRTPNFNTILSWVLGMTAVLLLAIYFCGSHRRSKARVLVPVAFGILSLNASYSIIYNLYQFVNIRATTNPNLKDLFIYLLPSIFVANIYILTFVSSLVLRGRSKKITMTISMSIFLILDSLLFLYNLFLNSYFVFIVNEHLYLYISQYVISFICGIAIHTSLLLFGLSNNYPPVIIHSYSKGVRQEESAEQALRNLKYKLDFGVITLEEYQAKRYEIISKL